VGSTASVPPDQLVATIANIAICVISVLSLLYYANHARRLTCGWEEVYVCCVEREAAGGGLAAGAAAPATAAATAWAAEAWGQGWQADKLHSSCRCCILIQLPYVQEL